MSETRPDLPPPAIHRRRKAGEAVVVALDAGEPPLAVRFETPDALASAEIEAAVAEAMSVVRRTPGYLTRYGMAERAALTDLQVAALARTITAIESAIRLWRAWNYAEVDEAGAPAVVAMTPEAIAHVLSSANLRAAWMVQLDAHGPVERAEGNVYAASADTSSDGAADTAPTAQEPTSPAPAEDPDAADASAPG